MVSTGYISLEVLENLYDRGLDVTLIHRSKQINKLMDQDINQPIIDELEKRGITYRLNEEISQIDGHQITFTSGKIETYDLIIEGVGTHPNSNFIQSSNIKLDHRGFIPVNDAFQTNIPNIYALGDIITSHYRHVDLPAQVPLAWGAHAGYYPGNSPIHLRVYYEKESRKLLRAAAVGQQGIDKRIDILSMAMMNHMTVDELTEFEVAYALHTAP